MDSIFAMEEHERLCRGFETYGPLLTSRQGEVLALYFIEDLSLTEIAQALEISRQAVFDHLKRGSQQLEAFESALHCLRTEDQVKRGLRSILDHKDCPADIKKHCQGLLDAYGMEDARRV